MRVGQGAAGLEVGLLDHVEKVLHGVLGVGGSLGEILYLRPVVLFLLQPLLALLGLQAGVPVLQGLALNLGRQQHGLVGLAFLGGGEALALRYAELRGALGRRDGELELHLAEQHLQVHLAALVGAHHELGAAHGADGHRGAHLELFLAHQVRHAHLDLAEHQRQARSQRLPLLDLQAGILFQPDLALVGHQQHGLAAGGGAYAAAFGYFHVFGGGGPLALAGRADFHGAAQGKQFGLSGQNYPRQRYQKEEPQDFCPHIMKFSRKSALCQPSYFGIIAFARGPFSQ